MSVDLYDLKQQLSQLCDQSSINPERITCTVTRSRATGNERTDFAHGWLEIDVTVPAGKFKIKIRWEAEGQANPEKGWIIQPAPHKPGAGIFGSVSVVDDRELIEPTSPELDDAAYDFWSYLDIESLIVMQLPNRVA